jgi:hypothetical protein
MAKLAMSFAVSRSLHEPYSYSHVAEVHGLWLLQTRLKQYRMLRWLGEFNIVEASLHCAEHVCGSDRKEDLLDVRASLVK